LAVEEACTGWGLEVTAGKEGVVVVVVVVGRVAQGKGDFLPGRPWLRIVWEKEQEVCRRDALAVPPLSSSTTVLTLVLSGEQCRATGGEEGTLREMPFVSGHVLSAFPANRRPIGNTTLIYRRNGKFSLLYFYNLFTETDSN